LIIEQRNGRFYRFAQSLVCDGSDVEALLQKAHLRALDGLEPLQGEAQFGGWVGRIVVNGNLDSRRRRRPTIDIELRQRRHEPHVKITHFPFANPHSELDAEETIVQLEIRLLLEAGAGVSLRVKFCLSSQKLGL
jgi:DNA-directed RNA polymerase specialized sigma24 family protein